MSRELELLLISDTPSRNTRGAGVKIRVVQRIDNDGIVTGIEKRGYYTAAGVLQLGKPGPVILYKDLEAIVLNWKKVVSLLKTPPPVPLPKPAAPKPPEDIKPVPF